MKSRRHFIKATIPSLTLLAAYPAFSLSKTNQLPLAVTEHLNALRLELQGGFLSGHPALTEKFVTPTQTLKMEHHPQGYEYVFQNALGNKVILRGNNLRKETVVH